MNASAAPYSVSTRLKRLNDWVDEVVRLVRPDAVHWCDGSEAENSALLAAMERDGTLIRLNERTNPGSWLHRSHPDDVARVEHLTYVCTPHVDTAGPNNHWMPPEEGHAQMDALFDGCMSGRTMYVIPYCMGPIDSPLSRCGVEITDSPYVVVNMRMMTRMGAAALARIEAEGLLHEGMFVKGLHSIGELDPNRRFIMHFPEELTIKSYGSGYGGNALLGKKCHALRIASYQARSEGWLAEHMLILGVESPRGDTHYIAAAFPSACGKTNLAMLIPPEGYRQAGWKVWTIGDDICWMRPGADGRLYAINPEAGFFGVAPGTSINSNPNALTTVRSNTIFTNVGLTADNQPWWEGLQNGQTPAIDWRGEAYDPVKRPAAHPNSRFTVSAKQCPSYSPKAEDPQGVPISAIMFGGRRASLVPLVFEARDWTHGVLVGAAMGSETTAAATGAVGVMRRDPMAMKPFCGYNFADYFTHWLSFGGVSKLPRVFHVNWFRKGDDGKFLWPGFGENLRVLEWMIRRVEGEIDALHTPIGALPKPEDLNLDGIDLGDVARDKLFGIDREGWRAEFISIGQYLDEYGPRMPAALKAEQARILAELSP